MAVLDTFSDIYFSIDIILTVFTPGIDLDGNLFVVVKYILLGEYVFHRKFVFL
jgi:hypothetical protein